MSNVSDEIKSVGGPDDERYGMYIGDSRYLKEVLAQRFPDMVESDLVDVTITSPPYADKKNYEADEGAQIGFGQMYDEYIEDLRSIYRQTYEVTKESGTLWVVVNTIKKDHRIVNIPFDIVDICENIEGVERCEQCDDRLAKNRETGDLYCQQCGWRYDALDDSWRLQEVVIWDKERARPWSRKGQFRNVFEYILCFSKTKDFKFALDDIRIADPEEFKQWWVKYPERYNPRGKVPNNIWEMVTPTQGSWGDGDIDHPAPFPTEMVERIVNLTTNQGDVVFDPFAGSGTVLAQSEAMGRNPIGFELGEVYSEMYLDVRRRIVADWEERIEQGETLERQQERLERIICKLRQLNYPREMTRRLRKDIGVETLGELGINTAFQLSHYVIDREEFEADHLFMKNDLYWVVDEATSEERVQEIAKSAEKVSNEPPCSKFGIVANIEVLRTSVMADLLDDEQWKKEWGAESFYLYGNDTQNKYEGTLSSREWMQRAQYPEKWRAKTAKNNYPAILSNIELQVAEPEDEWRKQNGQDSSLEDMNATLTDF
jgi:DNA modification methylase